MYLITHILFLRKLKSTHDNTYENYAWKWILFLCKLKRKHMQAMLENKGNVHAP